MKRSYTDDDKRKWLTGLYAANPEQMRDLMIEMEDMRRLLRATQDHRDALKLLVKEDRHGDGDKKET
jgi:hypothetical protein